MLKSEVEQAKRNKKNKKQVLENKLERAEAK
jgi:hypothetical protein